MTLRQLAHIIHSVIEDLNRVEGQRDYPDWWRLAVEDQDLFITGVQRALDQVTHDADSAEALHEYWVEDRLAAGWTLGPRNYQNKTHPCLVPWKTLPERERVKDAVFLAMVKALAPLLAPQSTVDIPL